MKVYPKAICHVGVSVTQIEQAMEWYEKVFGFSVVSPPVTFKAEDPVMGNILIDLLGEQIQEVKIAHLGTVGGIGLELFEFIRPKSERYSRHEYWKGGFFHLSIIDPNIEELAQSIVENGGKQRSEIWESVPGSGYKMVYCEDPDGNLIEIYTHSVERMYSNWPQS